MPRAGFEPAQALAHCPLKTACLPVPPPRPENNYSGVEFSDSLEVAAEVSTASPGVPSSAGLVASN